MTAALNPWRFGFVDFEPGDGSGGGACDLHGELVIGGDLGPAHGVWVGGDGMAGHPLSLREAESDSRVDGGFAQRGGSVRRSRSGVQAVSRPSGRR
jgi:hypothetical protein